MTGGWGASLRRILLGALLLSVLGWWLDQLLLVLLLGALAYLGWNLLNLYRLDKWITEPAAMNPPDVPGIWGQVIYRIAGIQRVNRKAKKRLAKLLVEFRKSTEAMPDAAVVLDRQNRIAWYNSAASRLLGVRSEADLGQRIDNLLRAPDFRSYLRRKEYGKALLMASPANDRTLLSLRIIRYGKHQRLLLARDVTERATLERMRKDFVANASHELRTPVTVIRGYLEEMREEQALDKKWQAPIHEMHRQAKRMEKLIGDLLELSRLESSDAAAAMEPVDVRALANAVILEAQALAGAGPTLVSRVESEARLSGDGLALYSLLMNLVSNAVRFTPREGRIEIGWAEDAGGGRLWVSDNGTGIEAEHLPRLTERFYRVDAGRSRQSGGTGLGLSIVKHILESHGATLEIVSEPGQGSTFTCVFPPARIANAAAA